MTPYHLHWYTYLLYSMVMYWEISDQILIRHRPHVVYIGRNSALMDFYCYAPRWTRSTTIEWL